MFPAKEIFNLHYICQDIAGIKMNFYKLVANWATREKCSSPHTKIAQIFMKKLHSLVGHREAIRTASGVWGHARPP